jgi:hypothetical protein
MNWIGFICTLQLAHFTKYEKCEQEMARNGKKMPGKCTCLGKIAIQHALDWKSVHVGYIESLQFACKYVHFIKILEMCGKAVHKL